MANGKDPRQADLEAGRKVIRCHAWFGMEKNPPSPRYPKPDYLGPVRGVALDRQLVRATARFSTSCHDLKMEASVDVHTG